MESAPVPSDDFLEPRRGFPGRVDVNGEGSHGALGSRRIAIVGPGINEPLIYRVFPQVTKAMESVRVPN